MIQNCLKAGYPVLLARRHEPEQYIGSMAKKINGRTPHQWDLVRRFREMGNGKPSASPSSPSSPDVPPAFGSLPSVALRQDLFIIREIIKKLNPNRARRSSFYDYFPCPKSTIRIVFIKIARSKRTPIFFM